MAGLPAGLSVTKAMQQRLSTRAFHRDQPVPDSVLVELLEVALRAPSGGNTQPWHLYVTTGDARDLLCHKALKHMESGGDSTTPDFATYPANDVSAEYLDRRRKLGYAMYSLQGVDRKDRAGRAAAMAQNWEFFQVGDWLR